MKRNKPLMPSWGRHADYKRALDTSHGRTQRTPSMPPDNAAPSQFPTECSVAYLITLLTGKALTWATAIWTQQTPTCSTYNLFGEDALESSTTGSIHHAYPGLRASRITS
ncbi:hypothetical protein AAFF_G00045800 [Aldrovandia affinis]|uniref:Uncharacterized protein n=1 Tax=Aldrovandia affinis TaxID=143900 RepID=A0AAD7VXX0_9TELE|nr:hypothetical protein AAFF_G00045800 [Aldrovandia affinis]